MVNHLPLNIGIYAAAGALREPEALTRAEAFLAKAGHHVYRDAGVFDRDQRFAGSDQARLAAVNRMHNAPELDVALALRGGYGWSRLLAFLDYRALAEDKKIWVGHSDFTAFQLAVLARSGLITYAGPMACADFGAQKVSSFTANHCFDVLSAVRAKRAFTIACYIDPTDRPSDFSTKGILWGGNLSILTHLIGTPFFPKIENGILFLEDVNEPPYRIERMLYQLLLSGVLANQSAILLGSFTGFEANDHQHDYGLGDAVYHVMTKSGVPFFSGLPFGHVPDKLTLPMGAMVELVIAQDGAMVINRY
ncbi:MAG: LD-carboxypeptidase [Burkholderiales bacterium]|jgi:muramoyltetrapeptide carboxypeptidase|nr:LD-carboxypeptidase [Burkholderiales bacterium]